MEEWKEYKLGEISDIQTGPFGSQLHKSDYVEEGIPCIMPTNIGQQLDIDVSNIAHINEIDANRLNRHLVKEGDIIYARRGDIEKCAYISEKENGWFCGTGCLRLRINENNNPHFIAYYLSTQECKKWIVGNAVGTTMLNLNSSILKELPLYLPSKKTQSKIVSILKSLDDKIENNRKINENLEQQAQALFKSWFVDFEPFRDQPFVESELGMIPEGWRVFSFSEFLAPSTQKVGKDGVPEFSVTNTGIHPRDEKFSKKLSASSANNKLLRKDNLVFGMSREILNWGIMHDSEGGVSSAYNIYIVDTTKVEIIYLENYIKNNMIYFQDLIKPASREGQSLDKAALLKKQIYVPTCEILDRFYSIYNPLTSAINNNEKESRRLSLLRDTLLPKLMSGEITL